MADWIWKALGHGINALGHAAGGKDDGQETQGYAEAPHSVVPKRKVRTAARAGGAGGGSAKTCCTRKAVPGVRQPGGGEGT